MFYIQLFLSLIIYFCVVDCCFVQVFCTSLNGNNYGTKYRLYHEEHVNCYVCTDDWNINHRWWSKRCTSKEGQHKKIFHFKFHFTFPLIVFIKSVNFLNHLLILFWYQQSIRRKTACTRLVHDKYANSLTNNELLIKSNTLKAKL